ncbi:MAG TPA: hypothetical protein P5513_08390 [Candidatus Diapherotrites archaeon]|nr:hypothetical protein [Candidatus Diapherotrites archaeon]
MKQEKIYLDTKNDSDEYIFTINSVLAFHSNNGIVELIPSNDILLKEIDYKNLEGYDPIEQEFFDIIGLSRYDIKNFCSSAYKIGVNPIPPLRNILNGSLPVYYSCSNTPQLSTNNIMDKEKPYLIIIHDKKSNNVDVVLGYFEYFSNDSEQLEINLGF